MIITKQPETERISISDTHLSALEKLSEGNPGALTVLLRVLSEGGPIDPQSAFQGWTGLMILDSIGIYGADIWVLYKDVADSDLVNFLALLRAVQMGFFSRLDLRSAIATATRPNVQALRAQLKAALPQSKF